MKLFVDPFLTNQGRAAKIANQPIARWFGDWNTNVQGDVNTVVSSATSKGEVPSLVAYNIPKRDCGSYSAGGATSSSAYATWIRQFAAGIGQRQAIVILEPDALAGMDCLSSADQNARLASLSDAVTVLTSQTNAFVYIDAGNPGWQTAATMASRLQSANIAASRGFSLNVSNFYTTSSVISYGDQILQASSNLNNKYFVFDTSRNGNGPTADHQWCNPAGRALGLPPTTNTGLKSVDAELWIKVPGQSDGTCGPAENGTNPPSAGTWWDAYAQMLIANASW